MHYDIGTKINRTGQKRRGNSVVNHHNGTSGLGQFGNSGDIGDLPIRVGRGFKPHQLGLAGNDVLVPIGNIGVINKIKAQPGTHTTIKHEAAQRPIHYLGGNNMITRVQRMQNRNGGRHARGKQAGFRTAFKFIQDCTGLIIGRVVCARIAAPVMVTQIRVAFERG